MFDKLKKILKPAESAPQPETTNADKKSRVKKSEKEVNKAIKQRNPHSRLTSATSVQHTRCTAAA